MSIDAIQPARWRLLEHFDSLIRATPATLRYLPDRASDRRVG